MMMFFAFQSRLSDICANDISASFHHLTQLGSEVARATFMTEASIFAIFAKDFLIFRMQKLSKIDY